MSMISWQFIAPDTPLRRVESPLPEPGKDEVLIEIAGCGVCHTDLGFFYNGVKTRAPLPLTLGHEISGVVKAAGSDAVQWIDKAVVVPAVIPCGECDVCHRDLGNICAGQKMPGNDIHGGFSSHIVVPAAPLCHVPVDNAGFPVGDVRLDLAELSVVADAVTTPYQAIKTAGLTAKDTAIFIGVGGIGGFGAQIAKAMGATVVAIDIDPSRLTAIRPYVDQTFDSTKLSTKALRRSVTDFVKSQDRRRIEWKVFECSGTASGQETAFDLMTFGAHLSVVGFTLARVEIRLSSLMAFHATARGNWGCIPRYYPPALELILSGKIDIRPFVKKFSMEKINEVFKMVLKRQILERPILVP